jgi:peptidylprolyl isomerase
MAQAKDGDTVRVHFTGKLKSGETFDSSHEGEPLEFTIGKREVIPGFEQGVIGMSIGERKTVGVPADEAYGPHHDAMVLVVDRSQLPSGLDPQVGQQLRLDMEDGRRFVAMVRDAGESTITLDANHPLAGRELIYDIELLEVL